ncbi:MAG: hypothetical protein LBT53_00225, partial [Puniceicoccales bacterium]|nr:hypothetical protein [Puniceicoccales bacterium]
MLLATKEHERAQEKKQGTADNAESADEIQERHFWFLAVLSGTGAENGQSGWDAISKNGYDYRETFRATSWV